MAEIELDVPDRIHSEIDRLVESGEFLNREQAIEELLSLGVSAHSTEETTSPEAGEELFTQTVEDQQDPAMRNEGGDEFSR